MHPPLFERLRCEKPLSVVADIERNVRRILRTRRVGDLDYGLRDFSHYLVSDPADQRSICSEIVGQIREFEPRLMRVQLTTLSASDSVLELVLTGETIQGDPLTWTLLVKSPNVDLQTETDL